jgi:2-polyprenyl-6-methoxyphenol hydroxylase-like FAD-dependent oxidoreductase
MAASADKCDVLVVGAGPTGLLLASELVRHGAACRIIDKAAAPCAEDRATSVHSRTMEIMQHLGIAERFVALGNPLRGTSTYTQRGDKRVFHLGFDEMDSPFPFVLGLEQFNTERLLIDHLATLGAQVERKVELLGFQQDAAGVDATLRHSDGREEQLRVRYLVGCDGAHSRVRHTLSLEFEGTDYAMDFLTGDFAIANWRFPDDEIAIFLSPAGSITIAPLARHRFIFFADLGEADLSQPVKGEPTLEEVQRLMDERGPLGTRFSDPTWKTYFRIHSRQVSQYRQGRVFLAGDAAHIQSPIGGKGMNTGLQDAFNLGWKLALVLKGEARPTLLDSYHPERHQAGKETLMYSDKLHRSQVCTHPTLTEALRRQLSNYLSTFEVMQQRMRRTLAELNVSYRHSPAVAEHRSGPVGFHFHGVHGVDNPCLLGWHDFGAGPHAGDRAVDAALVRFPAQEPVRVFDIFRGSTKHHLFLLEGAHTALEACQRLVTIADRVRAQYARLIDIHLVMAHAVKPLEWDEPILLDPHGEMHHRYGARHQCLYLVRPDDYIGFRSQPAEAEELLKYLGRIFA